MILNGDDPNIAALGPAPWTRIVRVGVGEGCDVRIADFNEDPSGSRFRLGWRGQPWTDVEWGLPGLYNARNAAMAATAAGLMLATPPGSGPIAESPVALELGPLSRFRGVRRRQEVLVQSAGLVVIEDFGHHPTALEETLRSARARYPRSRITAVFEPRSNTARTKALQPEFIRALARADEVYIGAVSRSERLRPEERFDSEGVAKALASQGIDASAHSANHVLLERLVERTLAARAKHERLVIFFSNGSFDGITADFAAQARQTAP